MTKHEEITTTEIELAAAIMTATNRKPVKITPGRELVEFIFPIDEAVMAVVLKYAEGKLLQEVRRLGTNRRWLYRLIREVARTGREVRP